MRLSSFLQSEAGAVAVDWVVLTAGTVMLGVATIGVISGGAEDLSGEIQSSLAGIDIGTAFEVFEAVELALHDFTGGEPGDWIGGRVANLGGELGELLQLGAGDVAELTFSVPARARQAVISFDLIGGDSLDSESATIMINGQPVVIATGNHGAMSFASTDVNGITTETVIHVEHAQLGGSTYPDWRESTSTVTITLDDPGSSVTLGIASGTDQPRSDEFFGVDNVNVTAR